MHITSSDIIKVQLIAKEHLIYFIDSIVNATFVKYELFWSLNIFN